ncbi:SDR family oxidoreductase [Dongia deserti]|uniref:SDR family oxidoreductase n=1 Tax=Dongia deserti TaxID=2268030 RepID=UPI000E64C7A0|nr:SDR family oxidoreductase [Dongia deserti]
MRALMSKVVIITGASSGIGRAAAKLFAEEGAKLVVAARRKDALDTLVAEIAAWGGEAIAYAGDVKDEGLHQHLVETAQRAFGGLDAAFNNAGTLGEMGPTPQISLAGWNDALETNLTSAFLAAKYQIPLMLDRGGGSLIFTSTFVGYTAGMPGVASYAAGKAGLIGLTQALATEFGPRGIRVNALLPGGTDTPMAQAMIGTPEGRQFVENMHALKRIATPEEIAKSALYLASDASSFTTGTAMLVDGGVSINRT